MSLQTTARAKQRVRFALGPTLALRVPLWPVELLEDVLAASEPLVRLRALLEADGELRASIAIASPSLGAAIARMLAGTARDEAAVLRAAFAYLARMTMRCTPFAVCATVGALRLGPAEGPPGAALDREVATRTRPDAGWYADASAGYERDPEAIAKLVLRASGTYRVAADRLRIYDPARMETSGNGARDRAPTPTSINRTPALDLVLEHAAGDGATGESLAAALLGGYAYGRSESLAFLVKLVELGVLVTELRLPLTVAPAAQFERLLALLDPPRVADFAAAGAAFAAADHAGSLAERVAALQRGSDRLAAIAPSRHYFQLDAARAVGATLPDSFGEQIGALFDASARITIPFDRAKTIADAIVRRYNEGREIPLLELLDGSEGIDFDALALERRASAERTTRDDLLLQIAVGAIRDRVPVIALEETALWAGRREPVWDDLAPAYEALIHVVRAADGELRPCAAGGFYEGAGKSLARFADLMPVGAVSTLLRTNAAGDGERTVDAEFTFLPEQRRTANIALRPNAFRYEIVEGVLASTAPERTIRLDDLVVGVRDGRAYVRSLRWNLDLHVHQSHMINPRLGTRAARLFSALGSSSYPRLGFSWSGASAKLPYSPRATLAGCIVSFATWRVPVAVARAFDSAEARAWRLRWSVPARLYLVHHDNRLLLNLDRAVCVGYVAALARTRADDAVVELQEAVPDFGDAWVAGPAGTHVAELAVSLERVGQRRAAQPARPAPEPIAKHVSQRAPGTEWLYLRCYTAAANAEHVLKAKLLPLLASLGGLQRDFHFLRYADPEPHLRLRFEAVDEQALAELTRRVLESARAWSDSGCIARFEVGTYDREIERYGGIAAMPYAERVFTVDSLLVVKAIAAAPAYGDAVQQRIGDVAAFALALAPEPGAALAALKDIVPRRKPLERGAWDAVRAVRTGAVRWEPRYAALGEAMTALRAQVESARWPGVRRALLHMHCNRIGLSPTEEEHVLHLTIALLESQMHAR